MTAHVAPITSPSRDIGTSLSPASGLPANREYPAGDNRRVRVFVSSTFRDMQEERNELMTHTWPELRRFCRERQVELVEVDLRWGIAEEQSTRKETLKLCLDEIRHCRPFFIGLLGERYGWTPSPEAFTADLREEQPWLRELSGKSVTELEILHGVLNHPTMAGRSFFYFRDPAYAKSRGADFVSENAEAAGKQTALKTRVLQTCAEEHIAFREDYPDPHTLAAFVLEDLKGAIAAQFPVADIPDPLTRQARDHEAFAETRRRTYIGRPEYFARLDAHATGSGGPLVLLGESGSGKSALIANWIQHWRAEHPRDFVFQHYIGGTPDSADHWRLMTRLIAEIKRWSDDLDDVPRSHEDLKRDFGLWLAKGRARAEYLGVRAIIALDALNQLEDQDHARLLGWLPDYPLVGALRLIVSTLPGEALDAVRRRGWEALTVGPLSIDERRSMIEHHLARFGKKLDVSRLDRIVAAPAAAGPLYLKILLDELRVTGTYEGLDARLDAYLAASDIPSLLRQILDRWRHDYERDRPGLVGEALGLISAARRGLTEPELLHLIRPPDLAQLPAAIWSPFRAALDESLVDRDGILNFAHDFLRTAVERAFVADKDGRDSLRLQLADEFEKQSVTARGCDELPWLLDQTKQNQRLRSCLLDLDWFLGILNRDREELRRYWVRLGQERAMGEPYAKAFQQWVDRGGLTTERASFAALQLASFLEDAAQYQAAESLLRRALAIAEIVHGSEDPRITVEINNLAQILQDTDQLAEAEQLTRRSLAIHMKAFGPDNPDIGRDLNNLATLLISTNRTDEAEISLQRSFHTLNKSLGPNHIRVITALNNLAQLFYTTRRYQEAEPILIKVIDLLEKNLGAKHPYVASALSTLGSLYQDTNRLTDAETMLRRALEIDEENYGSEHPSVARDLNNLAQLLKATNRLAEAEPLMRRALVIDEECLGPEHSQVATDLNNLALLLEKMNRLSEAEPLARRVVKAVIAFTGATGHPHPHFHDAVESYLNLLTDMGWNHEQILSTLRELLPGFTP